MTVPGVRRAAPHRARPRARADRAPGRAAGVAGRQRVARRDRRRADRGGRARGGSTPTAPPPWCCRGPPRPSSSSGPPTPLGVEPVDGGAWAERWQQLGDAPRSAPSTGCSTTPRPRSRRWPGRSPAACPPAGRSVASSSMPIRDLEWYVRPDHELAVHANRGANGIDGVVSTAVGVALGDYSRPDRAAHRRPRLPPRQQRPARRGAARHRPGDRRGRQRRRRHLLVPPAGRVRRARALRAALRHAPRPRPRRPGRGPTASPPARSTTSSPPSRAAVEAGGVHVLVARTDRDAQRRDPPPPQRRGRRRRRQL